MFCAKCGHEVSGKFCAKCGTPVISQPPIVAQPPIKPNNKAKGLGILIVVGIVLLVVFVVMLNVKEEPIRTQTTSKIPVVERTGNVAHDLLMTRSERDKMAILSQSFIDNPCNVNRVFYAGMSKDKSALWHVGCTNGNAYQIMIKADAKGTSSYLDYKMLKLMSNLDCFVKLSDQK
jgi:hypothetical protein